MHIQLSVSVLRNIRNNYPSDTSNSSKKYNPGNPKHVWRTVREYSEPTTLNKFNNTYNWCNYHKKWVTYTNEECGWQRTKASSQTGINLPTNYHFHTSIGVICSYIWSHYGRNSWGTSYTSIKAKGMDVSGISELAHIFFSVAWHQQYSSYCTTSSITTFSLTQPHHS